MTTMETNSYFVVITVVSCLADGARGLRHPGQCTLLGHVSRNDTESQSKLRPQSAFPTFLLSQESAFLWVDLHQHTKSHNVFYSWYRHVTSPCIHSSLQRSRQAFQDGRSFRFTRVTRTKVENRTDIIFLSHTMSSARDLEENAFCILFSLSRASHSSSVRISADFLK